MQQQPPMEKKPARQKKKGKKREITVDEAIRLSMEWFKKDLEYLKDH